MPDFSPPQFLVDALVEATKTTAGHQHTRSQVCIVNSRLSCMFIGFNGLELVTDDIASFPGMTLFASMIHL